MANEENMRVYFQAIGVLQEINLEFTGHLGQLPEVSSVHVDTDQPLVSIPAKLQYTSDTLKVHQSFFPAIPMFEKTAGPPKFFRKAEMLRSAKIASRCDVLHLNDLYSVITRHIVNSLGDKKPLIMTVHQKPRGEADVKLLNKVKTVVAPSSYFSEYLREHYGIQANVIHHGVNHRLFYPPVRSKKADCDDCTRILWSGRLVQQKSPEILLEAIPLVLAKMGSTVKFVIKTIPSAGRSEYIHKLEDLKRAFPKNITINKRRLLLSGQAELFRNADIFGHTSTFESFGLTLPEAMSTGLPVIATEAATSKEILGNAGTYFKPEDSMDFAEKIVDLVCNRDEQVKLGRRGRERCARLFTTPRMAKDYLKQYTELI